MKNVWLFLIDKYYPGGGIDDLEKRFDTVEEAVEHANSVFGNFHAGWHVLDISTGLVVAGERAEYLNGRINSK